MVVIVNESTVNTNPKMLKYKNLAAFALGKAPSLTDVVDKDGKPVVNYNYVNFLPDKDTINAVINGDMSAKKVIKKAIKALRNPSTENQAIGMTVVHLVHMITDEYRTKNQIKDGPSVLAFILDDPDSDAQQAINKFLTPLCDCGVPGVWVRSGYQQEDHQEAVRWQPEEAYQEGREVYQGSR